MPGRAVPCLLSDYAGPLNIQVPCAFVSAILAYSWLGIDSLGPLLAIAVLYGFFSGGMLALPPASMSSLTKDMSHFGARMGLCFVGMAVGSLIGTPVTGAIIGPDRNAGDGNWDGARIWSGTTILAGGLLMAASRVAVGFERRDGREWWRLKA